MKAAYLELLQHQDRFKKIIFDFAQQQITYEENGRNYKLIKVGKTYLLSCGGFTDTFESIELLTDYLIETEENLIRQSKICQEEGCQNEALACILPSFMDDEGKIYKEKTAFYCPIHASKWFCLGCGDFIAGISGLSILCEHCQSEVEETEENIHDEYDGWEDPTDQAFQIESDNQLKSENDSPMDDLPF